MFNAEITINRAFIFDPLSENYHLSDDLFEFEYAEWSR
jgi:hypothetical protein